MCISLHSTLSTHDIHTRLARRVASRARGQLRPACERKIYTCTKDCLSLGVLQVRSRGGEISAISLADIFLF